MSKKVNSDLRGFRGRVRRKVVVEFPDGSSRTKQSDAKSSDINFIMRRYGGIPVGNSSQLVFGDVSEVPAFDECLNVVIRGQAAFDALPSGTRARFHNDPAEFIAFISDDSNRDEAIKLGLVEAPAEQPNASPNPAKPKADPDGPAPKDD